METYDAYVDLALEAEGVVVVAEENGVFRIVSRDWGITVESRTWRTRESTLEYTNRVARLVPAADRGSIGSMINLAHHSLSPLRIGATLLYALEDPPTDSQCRSAGNNVESLGLRVTNARDLPLIQHQLKFTDRAALFAKDGRLLRTAVMLKSTGKSGEAVGELSGARHTSAARHTFDDPGVVAVVVSADGPVSIFSDGQAMAHLPVHSLGDDIQSWNVPGVELDTWGYRDAVECPACHVKLDVKTVIVPGHRLEETANCPVCGTEVASEMCMDITAELRKTQENIAALRAFRTRQ